MKVVATTLLSNIPLPFSRTFLFLSNLFCMQVLHCYDHIPCTILHLASLHLCTNNISYAFFMLPIFHKHHFNGGITVHHMDVLSFNNFFYYLFSFLSYKQNGKLCSNKHISANIFIHICFPLCLRLFHLERFLEWNCWIIITLYEQF